MELTNEEKASIVSQHIRNVTTNIYNLQVTLLAEEALSSPNQNNIDSLNFKISEELRKNQALLTELAGLQG